MIAPSEQASSLSIDEFNALGGLMRGIAWEGANGTAVPDSSPASVVARLVGQGHPPLVAIRIACSGQIAWVHPKASTDDDSRPGAEIAEGVDRAFGQVIELLGREWLGKGGAL